jgi:hypothetical protein
LRSVRVFKGPARLLDQLLEEGRLRDDAHGALAEFLDGLGDNEHLLAVDPAVPRLHPAARYGLENSPEPHLEQGIDSSGHEPHAAEHPRERPLALDEPHVHAAARQQRRRPGRTGAHHQNFHPANSHLYGRRAENLP